MLKNKSVIKFISLVLAIGLWAYVIGEVNPTVKKTVDQIPVELTNVETLEENGLALGEEVEYYTSIVVEGSRAELNSLKVSDIHATADVYGYTEGENHVSVDVALPDRISLKEVKIPEVTVNFEKLAKAYLPVTIEFVGESGESLEPSYNSYSPSEIEVKGAESVIGKVHSVRVQMDMSDFSETWDIYSGTPLAMTKDGKIVKNVTMSADSVDVEAVMHHLKIVPLELKVTGSPDEKYGDADVIIPDEITVKGNAYALERVTVISAEPVDISEVTKNTTIKISPMLPEGIELADSSKDTGVKIEFK